MNFSLGVTFRPNIWLSLQDEGQSSRVKDEYGSRCISSGKSQPEHPIEDLSSMFKHFPQIIEQKDVEIFLNITIRKRKGNMEENGKQRGRDLGMYSTYVPNEKN